MRAYILRTIYVYNFNELDRILNRLIEIPFITFIFNIVIMLLCQQFNYRQLIRITIQYVIFFFNTYTILKIRGSMYRL